MNDRTLPALRLFTRLRDFHTIQYGWLDGEIVRHTEDDDNPNIRERMNRCAVCEQWSPCDVRMLLDVASRETIALGRAVEATTGDTTAVLAQADSGECCEHIPHYTCHYHQGFEDGADALLAELRRRAGVEVNGD